VNVCPPATEIVVSRTSLHNVTPITRGSRRPPSASFFWTQSLNSATTPGAVMLFDLDMAIRRLAGDHPEHPSVVSLTSILPNLLRQWARFVNRHHKEVERARRRKRTLVCQFYFPRSRPM